MNGTNNNLMPKQKLVILSAFYEPYMSGAEQMVKEICERLDSTTYEIHLVTSRIDKSLAKVEKRDNFILHRVGFGFSKDKFVYPFFAALKVRSLKPSIVHAIMESYAGIALVLTKVLYRKAKRILTLQSGDLDDLSKQKKLWIKLFWKKIHTTPHVVTAISSFLLKRAERLGVPQHRLFTTPNGIDLSKVPDNIQKKSGKVICVARHSWEKGLNYLLDSWPVILKQVPHATLTLVGDGPLRNELEQQVKDLHITQSVRFTGFLDHAEVLNEISSSEVFVCPSLAEGLGNVFIEAQACGTAPVGTDVGGIPDIIFHEENGLLIKEKSAQSIADAVARLLSDSELRHTLEIAARENVKRFQWDTILSSIENIYQSEPKFDICLATGIYPPDIGGPAVYVPSLAKELISLGHTVSVLTYSNVDSDSDDKEQEYSLKRIKRGNTVINYIRYFFALLKITKGKDIIYTFDTMSAGLPTMFVSFIRRIPYVVRVGGDFIWERYIGAAKDPVSLREFYAKQLYTQDKFRFFLINRVLSRAKKLMFTTQFQLDLFEPVYRFKKKNVTIINNPIPNIEENIIHEKKNNTIVFPCRFIEKSNLFRLMDAFDSSINPDNFTLVLVGDGPIKKDVIAYAMTKKYSKHIDIRDRISRKGVWKLFADSHAFICPSITDISPNSVMDAIAIGIPFAVTKETGYDWLSTYAYCFDPMSVEDITKAFNALMNEETYQKMKQKEHAIFYNQTMSKIAKDIELLTKEIV